MSEALNLHGSHKPCDVRPTWQPDAMRERDDGTVRCHLCAVILEHHRSGTERICVTCRRRRGREHYRKNREYYLRKARRHRTFSVERAWALVWQYLETHPCVDCGNTDPRVLEFDHRDRSQKRASVSVLVAEGYGVSAVQAEIQKCDVRCANCHTIKTREEAGWFRSDGWRARRDSNSQPSDP